MKNLITVYTLILFSSFTLLSCGDNDSKVSTKTNEAKIVDVCRCLTEPGNSEWSKLNRDACRDAISKEIGVENWEKVNMSQNPDISAKFDALAEKCIGKK